MVHQSDNDKALIVTAGITLHEALKAYEILKDKGINIRIIDLYSLQPFDSKALYENAKACNNNAIAVEDHYCNALGAVVNTAIERVTYLCVRDIPRSGKPDELFKQYGIDAEAIIRMVEQFG